MWELDDLPKYNSSFGPDAVGRPQSPLRGIRKNDSSDPEQVHCLWGLQMSCCERPRFYLHIIRLWNSYMDFLYFASMIKLRKLRILKTLLQNNKTQYIVLILSL